MLKQRKKTETKKYKGSDLVYNKEFSFYRYHNINKFRRNSFTKYIELGRRHLDLDKFNSIEPRNLRTEEKKFQ